MQPRGRCRAFRGTRWIAAALACAAVLAPAGRCGEAAPLPAGVAMTIDTSDLASLERAIMFFSNSMMPRSGPAQDGAIFDQAFRTIQNSGQMPSLVNPLVQQFFGLPGVEILPGRGVSMALFIPQGNEAEGDANLAFAAWLPVKSFAELLAGVKAGRREWSHIEALPDLPNILSISYNRYGVSTMYMSASPSGAVLSTTLWGLARAQRHWRSGPGAALSSAGGFNARLAMDFVQPGVEQGLVALLSTPSEEMMRRLRSGGGRLIGDFTLFGLLHAVRQSSSLELRLAVGVGGDITMDADLVAKPESQLSVFLGNAANHSLTPRLLAAMPDNLSVAFSLAGGAGVKDLFAGYVRDAAASMTASGRSDDFAKRLRAILQGVELLIASAAGETAAAITLDGCGLAAFVAESPAAAVSFAGRFAAVGGDGASVRAQGGDVVVAVGLDAAGTAAATANGIAAGEQGTLRPGLARLFDSLGGKGVFAFACYPAELVRLILVYKAKETYMSGGPMNKDNPMDMFATAFLGTLVRNMEEIGPGRHPLTVAADSPRPNLLRIHAGMPMLAMSEVMATYQRAILTFAPGAGALGGMQ